MKPLALQMYTLREMAKEDFVGTLKTVAGIGYAGVEFAGLHGHGPAEIRKVLDDLGMPAVSSHLAPPTPETLNETVDTAGALGYRYVVVSYMPPENFQTLDAVQRTAEQLQACAEMLQPHGLTLCYHNHSHEMVVVEGKHALEHLLELAPGLQAQIDTYWASNFEAVDVPAFVAKWSSRCPLLHVKDGPLVRDEPMLAIGSGKMDFTKIIPAADDDALQWLIVELDRCATDMLQAVKDSFTYLTDNGLAEGRC